MDPNDPRVVDFKKAVEAADAAALESVLGKHPELVAFIDQPWFGFGAPAVVHLARSDGRAALQVLLEAGADPDAKSDWAAGPYSALDRIVDSKEVDDDLADYLLSRGATLDIHAAAGLGRVGVVQELLDAAPERVNEPGPDGAAPLHLARDIETAALLLARGADMEQRCVDHNSTPVMWSVQRPPEVTRFLVEQGARADLFTAAVLDDVELARRILAADPDAAGVRVRYGASHPQLGGGDKYVWALDFADTPAEVARRRGHEAVLAFLLEHSDPIRVLLMHARSGNVDGLQALLDDDPDLLSSLSSDQTCELLCGTARTAGLLLDSGLDPNAVDDESGATALHHASWKNDRERIEVLLAHGADPGIRDRAYQSTPIGWAHESGHMDLVQMYAGRFRLDILDATWVGDEARVLELLAADPAAAVTEDESQVSLLRMAAWHGHLGIAKALLEAGADPNARNAETGKTARDMALERGHDAIAELLSP